MRAFDGDQLRSDFNIELNQLISTEAAPLDSNLGKKKATKTLGLCLLQL